MTKYYLAIDMGASSGRHIIGYKENGEIKTEEIYRFSNGVKEENGHFVWDTKHLFSEIVAGLKESFKKYPKIESLAIDTWGVDYALIKNGETVYPVYAYRDGRTEEPIRKVHEIISEEKLYEKTGIAFQTYNTIYQLYSDKLAGRLDGVTDFLMLPEYFSYLLTGNMKKEYTMATTTGLVNVKTHEFDKDIVKILGLPEGIFKPLTQGGTVVGRLKKEIAKEVGGDLDVKLCLSHDTASAFHAIDEDAVYISSGTWSLLGLKQDMAHVSETCRKHGFTNEGGVSKSFRFLKNIMGMWVINNICSENETNPIELAKMAQESDFKYSVNVNDNDFFAPRSMTETVKTHLKKQGSPIPDNLKDLAKCVLNSLANTYAESVKQLEQDVGRTYDKIVIVGGGAKNKVLNALTEKYSNKKVIAMPIEATAIGNIKIQIESDI